MKNRSKWKEEPLTPVLATKLATAGIELAPERDRWLKYRTEAFPVKAIIGPRFDDVYNCTTCRYGKEQLLGKPRDAHIFECWCGMDLAHKSGPRNGDIECSGWDAGPLVKRTRHEIKEGNF